MAVAPDRMIERFNILKDQLISMLIIKYLKTIEPFPFDPCMKGLYTSIIPWISLFGIAVYHILRGG
jgi:hypothetical protein